MKTIVAIFLFILGTSLNVPKPRKKSRHRGIVEISFVDLGNRLINEYTDKELANAYNKIKRKAFGQNSFILTKEAECIFIGKSIFSQENNSSLDYVYNYDITTLKTTEYFVSVTGSLSAKAAFKIKEIGAEKQSSIKVESSVKHTETIKEHKETKLVLKPYKKYTLREKGKAEITNGVIKKFVFGITVKKGDFEIIDVGLSWYEFYEEDIN